MMKQNLLVTDLDFQEANLSDVAHVSSRMYAELSPLVASVEMYGLFLIFSSNRWHET